MLSSSQINSNKFHWVKYGGFVVSAQTSNGYINITNICKIIFNQLAIKNTMGQNIIGKHIRYAIRQAAKHYCNTVDELIYANYENNDFYGLYVEPSLVPIIIMQIIPDFAIKVSKNINNILIKPLNPQIERAKTVIEGYNIYASRKNELNFSIIQNKFTIGCVYFMAECKKDNLFVNIGWTNDYTKLLRDISIESMHSITTISTILCLCSWQIDERIYRDFDSYRIKNQGNWFYISLNLLLDYISYLRLELD